MIKLFCDAVTPGPEALDFVNKTVFIIAIIAFVVTIISFAIVAIRRRKTKKFYGDGNKSNEKIEEGNDNDERLR
jgi:heme/copper-type cytochrome/quinol oxidase subunit 2